MGRKKGSKKDSNSDGFSHDTQSTDDGWEVVVDRKKLKQQERFQRKQEELRQEEARKKAEKRKEEAAIWGGLTHDSDEEDWTFKQSKNSRLPKKSKSKSSTSYAKPKTSEEVVALLVNIVESEPTDYVQIPTVSDRFQTRTNTAWNKGYKSKYGGIKKFLQKHSNVFTIKDDMVVTKKHVKAVAEHVKKSKKKSKSKTKSAKPEAAESLTSAPSDPTPDPAGGGDCAGVCLKATYVVLLFAGIAAATVYTAYGAESEQLLKNAIDTVNEWMS